MAKATPHPERIHFEGFQPMPARYVLGADVFVLASHREPFGLVLCEAREAGVPIVATNEDGIPEALDYGDAGLLVPPGRPDRLAEGVRRVLTDPPLNKELSRRAGVGLERFSVQRVFHQTQEVYNELLADDERNSGKVENLS